MWRHLLFGRGISHGDELHRLIHSCTESKQDKNDERRNARLPDSAVVVHPAPRPTVFKRRRKKGHYTAQAMTVALSSSFSPFITLAAEWTAASTSAGNPSGSGRGVCPGSTCLVRSFVRDPARSASGHGTRPACRGDHDSAGMYRPWAANASHMASTASGR